MTNEQVEIPGFGRARQVAEARCFAGAEPPSLDVGLAGVRTDEARATLSRFRLRGIIAGGQTGVDRGAMDAGMEIAIPVGGWAPRGFRAEDGEIPDAYRVLMTESTSGKYDARTLQNVIGSDATLVVAHALMAGPGTALTRRRAKERGRPQLWVGKTGRAGMESDVLRITAWLLELRAPAGVVLNVAGPRASIWPEGAELARELLLRALGAWR